MVGGAPRVRWRSEPPARGRSRQVVEHEAGGALVRRASGGRGRGSLRGGLRGRRHPGGGQGRGDGRRSRRERTPELRRPGGPAAGRTPGPPGSAHGACVGAAAGGATGCRREGAEREGRGLDAVVGHVVFLRSRSAVETRPSSASARGAVRLSAVDRNGLDRLGLERTVARPPKGRQHERPGASLRREVFPSGDLEPAVLAQRDHALLRATRAISAVEARATASRSISSVTAITSCRAIRPR